MRQILRERSVVGVFGATVLCMGLLVAWTKELRPGWIIAAALVFALACWLLARSQAQQPPSLSGRLLVALGLLLFALGAATAFSWQFQRLETSWSELLRAREERLGGALAARMTDVVERGRRAAVDAARLSRSPTRELFRQLDAVRTRSRVEAVAVFAETGELKAWSGEHRGPLPDSLLVYGDRPFFEERPLFSYLYFPQPAGDAGEYAVAVVLVETGFATDVPEPGFGDVFEARSRFRASFRHGGRPDAVWALAAGSDTIVHARLDPLTQAEWRGRLDRTARRLTLLGVLAAYLVLAHAWLRWTAPAHSRWAAATPLLLAIPLIAGLPLRGALGGGRLFSPASFVITLPIRGDISLGRLLALLVPITALIAGMRRPTWRPSVALVWIVAGALAVGVTYPLLLELLLSAATSTLRQGSMVYWIGLQLAAVLALAGATLLAMPRAARTAGERWRISRTGRRLLLAAGLVVSVGLAVVAAVTAQPDAPVRTGLAALWAVPFLLSTLALAPYGGRAGGLARWLMAGWLAGTAVLPQLWSAHVQARLRAGEIELATLGSEADTFRDYLLVAFGREALARFNAGEEGVLLLYRTWVASHLAEGPDVARIVLWSKEGVPEIQLGSAPALSEAEMTRLVEIVAEAREHPAPHLTPFIDLPTRSQLVLVPLPDGTIITVVVPPRRTLERSRSIAPFLGVVDATRTKLHLVDAAGEEPASREIEWVAQPEGWRSEAWAKYPEGWYHAHLLVAVPSMLVRFARATLLLTFDLAIFSLLWVIGVVARGGLAVPRGDWIGWLGSFRARITVALFAFFLMPTALFGWAAYGALAGEMERVAETIAQYSATQAVAEFDDVGGDLRELAAHAGTDVLRYHGGELIGVSSREALDLGVYSAWMPPDVYQQLVLSGESQEATHAQTLGGNEFVTAYRSLPPTGTLGIPLSLTTGDAPVRQQEFAHLVLFAAVVGALLSLVLSLAVGRALARPIGRLRWAATVVGAGKLSGRLPEGRSDEFGELFAAFNRMTRRLRQARAREIRTARVLAWGEMARQVAHEIKNPLTPIKLSIQHLRRAYADRHPQFEEVLDSNVSQILSEIDRLSDIARAFSRYGAPAEAAGPLGQVDVPAIVREALTLYRSGDRAVRYIDAVDPDLPRVHARPNELKEVLLNLVENSRSALNGSGDVVVRGRMVDDYVELSVADTGPGIAAELLPRIFDPHFSTRSTGTGLGLAIVRRIVESWGGSVTAESEVGRGTTIIMRLLPAG